MFDACLLVTVYRKTERDETSKYQLIADQTAKGFVISDRDWNMHVCAVTQLVEALRYNLEGGGFDSRWCHWIDIILPDAL